MRNYKVYKLTSPSNKVYIGITGKSLTKRWSGGNGYRHCPAMYKCIKKYGWNNIEKELLFDNLTEDEAKLLEKELIKYYKSFDKKFGYNLTEGGDGVSGRKLSEKQKEYIRKINSGKKLTEEQKEKIRQANLGKHHSEQTKRKMSESHKGHKYSLGTKLSEERKRQISERQKGSKNQRARKVICLETLKIYDTITEAKIETGASKIWDCCKHNCKHKSSGGFHWEYYDENFSFDYYTDLLWGYVLT